MAGGIVNPPLAQHNHRSKHPAYPGIKERRARLYPWRAHRYQLRLDQSFLDPIAGIGMPFHASARVKISRRPIGRL
jgi:hypothetical protein